MSGTFAAPTSDDENPQTSRSQATDPNEGLAGWSSVLRELEGTPLTASATATIPRDVRGTIPPAIQYAHAAGLQTGLGTPTTYEVPDNHPIIARVLSAYFSQGLQYGVNQ